MRGANQLWDYNGKLNGKETYKNKCWAGLFMIRLQRGNLRGERSPVGGVGIPDARTKGTPKSD